MNPAVVLGMRLNGLGVVRGLGREGVEVYGVEKEDLLTFCSRYCKRKYIFPDPVVYPDECLNQFLELGKSLDDKAVMIPTNDSYVAFMSRFRTELSEYFLFNIPDAHIIDSILDKTKQYQLAAKLGIPVPRTISPKHIDDLKEGDISFPAIIKGQDSHKWSASFDKNGFAASSYEELREYFQRALDRNIEVVIQEMIIGSNKNHYGVSAYYSQNGEFLATWATQRARQFPVDMGDGTYIITIDNPELIALARKFLEGMNYTGAGNLQVKYDDRDGQYKLIELNPRFGMANIIGTTAGINSVYINYLDCIGEKVTPALTVQRHIRWLNAITDISAFRANRKRGDITFIEWLKSVLKANCFPYFARDDLKPLCKLYMFVTWRFIKRIFKLAPRKQ